MSAPSRDEQPVFAALAEAAARLSEAAEALIYHKDGDQLRLVARHGASRTARPSGKAGPLARSTVQGRATLGRVTIRTGALVAAPMLLDGTAVGAIVARRGKARPFSPAQVGRLEAFAVHAALVIQELEARDRELAEALAQQTATAEVVRAISSSTDMRRVFDMIAENAVKVCHGQFGGVFQFDGELVHLVAQHGLTPEGVDVYARSFPRPPGRDSAMGRAILDRSVVHIADVQRDPEYGLTALALAGAMRCIVAVPVLREGAPIGGIVAWQSTPEPFHDKQIELLKTFADQALIAIENARLFTELEARNRDLTETLEQQTATAEILRAISGSPTDIQPVLDTVVRAAARFCGATDVVILRLDAQTLRGAAGVGRFAEVIAREVGGSLTGLGFPVTRGSVTGRAVVDRRTVHVHDLAAENEDEFPEGRDLQRRFGNRTMAATPLLREGTPLGAIALFRAVVDPFSDKQLELLRVFADQAVIAIENVRLFTELEARNQDLTETLEQQTATSEILRIISTSPTDLQPVLQAVAESAARLCGADDGHIWQRDGATLHRVASWGGRPVARQQLTIGRRSVVGRAAHDRAPVHVDDLAEAFLTEFPDSGAMKELGYRTILAVPLLREGLAIGVIMIRRTEVRPFTDKQIDLVKTFADQAVIAIENVRLFKELEVRNRDLTETLEQQTATSEILRVISSSPTDIQPVFDTIAGSAAQLCEAQFCHLFRFDGTLLHFVAHHGLTPEGVEAFRRAFPVAPDRGSSAGRAALSGMLHHIPDVHADPEYRFGELARFTSFRSIVAVPMVREGRVIGTVNVGRAEAGHFSDRQLDLLKTFADQAVIAIENVRLFAELEARNRDLIETLEQQTATSEILRVISSSPTDVQPVFDTIVANAVALCGASFGGVLRFDGEFLHVAAAHNVEPERLNTFHRLFPMRPTPDVAIGRAILERSVIHFEDVLREAPNPLREAARQALDYRAWLAVPMLQDGTPFGVIFCWRPEPRGFTDAQVALVRTFADQAVIAIENVRLFKELEAKNRDLT
jgi:GAF domain-containing protein